MSGSILFGRRLVAVMLVVVVQGASAQGPASELEGSWAGDRAHLVFDGTGGHLRMDCASGAMTNPVKMAPGGVFSAAGSFERHRPGSQAVDGAALAGSAQFLGEIKDGVMTLSIQTPGSSPPQVLHLRRGASVKLLRCL